MSTYNIPTVQEIREKNMKLLPCDKTCLETHKVNFLNLYFKASLQQDICGFDKYGNPNTESRNSALVSMKFKDKVSDTVLATYVWHMRNYIQELGLTVLNQKCTNDTSSYMDFEVNLIQTDSLNVAKDAPIWTIFEQRRNELYDTIMKELERYVQFPDKTHYKFEFDAGLIGVLNNVHKELKDKGYIVKFDHEGHANIIW